MGYDKNSSTLDRRRIKAHVYGDDQGETPMSTLHVYMLLRIREPIMAEVQRFQLMPPRCELPWKFGKVPVSQADGLAPGFGGHCITFSMYKRIRT